ncbi:hypothetical protein KAU11_06195 [Candidatus Babeliales bacterium]|nr:hypothetical protein [Candidatus Babeliales bacterium]
MSQSKQVLINGKAFSASDITVLVAGIVVASVSSLTATQTQEKTNNKGFSDEPVSRGRGTKEYEGSIDLSYTDALKLRNLSPTGGLLEVPTFEILAVLDNAVNVSRIRIKNAEFTDDGIEVSVDDTEIKRTYGLVIAGIDYL